MSTLTLLVQLTASDDALASSNPVLRGVDWKRNVSNIPAGLEQNKRFALAPGETQVFWDGSRTTGIDGTTAFSIALSPLDASRYRLTATGGTAPAFRTDRAFAANGMNATITVQANGSAILTTSGAANYAGVTVGDTVLMPGVETGDAAGPFDVTPTPGVLNTGYWVVLAKTGSSLTLARAGGFVGVTQTVAITNNSQLQVFSSPPPGVQVADTLLLSAGFAAGSLRAYPVLSVAPGYLDFQSAQPVPAETGITPGAAGLKLYTDAKRFFYVESDQRVIAQVNGDTSTVYGEVAPFLDGGTNVTQPGIHFRTCNIWKLAVFNPSAVQANGFVVGIGA